MTWQYVLTERPQSRFQKMLQPMTSFFCDGERLHEGRVSQADARSRRLSLGSPDWASTESPHPQNCLRTPENVRIPTQAAPNTAQFHPKTTRRFAKMAPGSFPINSSDRRAQPRSPKMTSKGHEKSQLQGPPQPCNAKAAPCSNIAAQLSPGRRQTSAATHPQGPP